MGLSVSLVLNQLDVSNEQTLQFPNRFHYNPGIRKYLLGWCQKKRRLCRKILKHFTGNKKQEPGERRPVRCTKQQKWGGCAGWFGEVCHRLSALLRKKGMETLRYRPLSGKSPQIIGIQHQLGRGAYIQRKRPESWDKIHLFKGHKENKRMENRLFSSRAARSRAVIMNDVGIILTRRFTSKQLRQPKQMIMDVLQPGKAPVAREQLAATYKTAPDVTFISGFRTSFDGSNTSGVAQFRTPWIMQGKKNEPNTCSQEVACMRRERPPGNSEGRTRAEWRKSGGHQSQCWCWRQWAGDGTTGAEIPQWLSVVAA